LSCMEWVLNSAVIAENTPLRLSTEQIANPEGTLRSLYKDFTLHDMREILWDVFSRSLAADDGELGLYPRYEMLFCYEEIIQVLEAGSLIYGEYQKRDEFH